MLDALKKIFEKSWDDFLAVGLIELGKGVFNHFKEHPETAQSAFAYGQMAIFGKPTQPVMDIWRRAKILAKTRLDLVNGNLYPRLLQRIEELETGIDGSRYKKNRFIVGTVPVPANLGDDDQKEKAAEKTADLLVVYAQENDTDWQRELRTNQEFVESQGRNAWGRFLTAVPDIGKRVGRTIASFAQGAGRHIQGAAQWTDIQAGALNQKIEDNRTVIESKIGSLGAAARHHLRR